MLDRVDNGTKTALVHEKRGFYTRHCQHHSFIVSHPITTTTTRTPIPSTTRTTTIHKSSTFTIMGDPNAKTHLVPVHGTVVKLPATASNSLFDLGMSLLDHLLSLRPEERTHSCCGHLLVELPVIQSADIDMCYIPLWTLINSPASRLLPTIESGGDSHESLTKNISVQIGIEGRQGHPQYAVDAYGVAVAATVLDIVDGCSDFVGWGSFTLKLGCLEVVKGNPTPTCELLSRVMNHKSFRDTTQDTALNLELEQELPVDFLSSLLPRVNLEWISKISIAVSTERKAEVVCAILPSLSRESPGWQLSLIGLQRLPSPVQKTVVLTLLALPVFHVSSLQLTTYW